MILRLLCRPIDGVELVGSLGRNLRELVAVNCAGDLDTPLDHEVVCLNTCTIAS